MTEEEVVNFNLTVDAVVETTHTTAAEIKSTKLKATTPADTNEWLNNIKGYTNLVHSLFGPICPHFFQGLKAEACNIIFPEAKAAILWIILLQARHFTQALPRQKCLCCKYAVKCVWKGCTCLHRVATDEEAKQFVTLLDKAITNPDKVGTGQDRSGIAITTCWPWSTTGPASGS
eukprot:6804930-Ditylum_brightwellii.AAC.1